jgi:hypothetical protein
LGSADMYVNAATDTVNTVMRTRKGQRPDPAVVEDLLSAAPATNGLNSEASKEAVRSSVITPKDPDPTPSKSKTPPPVES